jgi:hypothetical protein
MTTPLPTSPPALPREALALLTKLNEHRVEYVLAGELAAAIHGCPLRDPTPVIVPARFERNLDRLSRALRALHAGGRGHGTSPTPDLSAPGLRALGLWPLSTDQGALDLDFEPPGTAGHLDLFEEAMRVTLTERLTVEVVALADLLRIAEMRRSDADEALLPALRTLLARSPSLEAG